MSWSSVKGASAVGSSWHEGARHGRTPEYDPERGAKLDPTDRRSIAPLPTLPVPPGGENLTGKQFGRLTVYGYYGRGGSGSRWVVRCSCGYYEVRSKRALTNPTYAAKAACQVCDYEREMLAGKATPPPIRHEHLPPPASKASGTVITPPLARLFQQVVRMDPSSKFSDLALAAEIPLADVRPLLDAMVRHEILKMRSDGWYERGPLALAGPSRRRAG